MKKLKIIKNTVKIGLDEPVGLLHITDTHLTFDDERVSNRWRSFETRETKGQSADYFFQALEYAEKNNLFVVHTGDMIDFCSEANFAFVDRYLNAIDYVYSAGNHDFCHWVGEAKEDYAYKWEMIKRAAPHFKTNLYFDSRIVGGVNLVTLDNSYYLISEGQLEALKAEAARGYPIILCMHIPIYSDDYPEEQSDAPYVIAAPESLLSEYSEARIRQQTPDGATLKAVEYIKDEPAVKALICGHRHLNSEATLSRGKTQFVTHGSFSGYVREITVL